MVTLNEAKIIPGDVPAVDHFRRSMGFTRPLRKEPASQNYRQVTTVFVGKSAEGSEEALALQLSRRRLRPLGCCQDGYEGGVATKLLSARQQYQYQCQCQRSAQTQCPARSGLRASPR